MFVKLSEEFPIISVKVAEEFPIISVKGSEEFPVPILTNQKVAQVLTS